jgi:hypothetical protein
MEKIIHCAIQENIHMVEDYNCAEKFGSNIKDVIKKLVMRAQYTYYYFIVY